MLDIVFPQCMMAPNGAIVRFHDETNGESYYPHTNSFRPIEVRDYDLSIGFQDDFCYVDGKGLAIVQHG